MILLQQVGQRGQLLARQHVHDDDVPHGVTGQEAVREEPDDPTEENTTVI